MHRLSGTARHRLIALGALVLTCAVVGRVYAQAPQPTAQLPLQKKLIEAYRNTRTLEVDIDFEVEQREGRIYSITRTDFRLAFDRENKKVFVDGPTWLLVVNGADIRFSAIEMPGVHVERQGPEDLDYAAITATAEHLTRPHVPDLAMLMASNPVATLVDSNVLNMRGDGDALVVDTPDGEYRLNIDPETHLISSLVFAPQLSEVHVQQDLSLQVRFTNRIKNHNKPIDPKRFTFDAKDSKGYPTLLEASMRARQQASSRSRIIGRSAPSVVLKSIDGDEVDLSKVKADMVILDFWATWCGACKAFAPVYEAASENHPDILFGKVDTEAAHQLSESLGIRALPTIAVYRDSIRVFFQAGALPRPALDDLITQVRALDMVQVRAEIESHAHVH